MFVREIDKDNYQVKIINIKLDLYNTSEIKDLITKIFTKILKTNKIKGLVYIDIYTDDIYGIIIDIIIKNTYFFSDEIEVKINMQLNENFLYEIDYFDLKELKLNNYNLYYYQNKFYLNFIRSIDKDIYLKLLELSNIIYNDTNSIIEKGIKIN